LAVNLKILVTGASGMLGSSLVRRLSQVYADSDLFSIMRKSPLPTGVLSVSFDEVRQMKFDIVLHLASPASPLNHIDPILVSQANIELTHLVCQAVKPGGRLIYFSTSEVYGPNAGLGVTENQVTSPQMSGPRSFYPLTKLMGESISKSRNDIGAIIFRVFHTFGPGLRADDGRSFADFLWGAAQHGQVTMHSDGSAIRSFLHVEDFCSAVLTTLQNQHASGIYNLGSRRPMSLLEFAEIVSEVTRARVVRKTGGTTSSPILHLSPDTSRLEGLGWKQELSERDAISDTWKWILSTRHGPGQP